MKVFRSLDSFEKGTQSVATIGTFDGVHLGHKKILGRLIAAARDIGGESVVISFHPHPRRVLRPEDNSLRMLQSIDERISALEAIGIDKLLLIPFTVEFAQQDSSQFILEILVKLVGMKRIVIGYDHHFGKNRGGGIKELELGARQYGYAVEEIPVQQIDNANVSSTKARKAILLGDLETARKFLGYDYSLSGKVIEGQKIGRSIGYPTANILPDDPWKLIPAEGVYLAQLWVNGQMHTGMLNIGRKPTVGDHFPLGIEIHLFDFEQDIYGKSVRVEFLQWIRPDMKFASLEELIQALQHDREISLSLIQKRNS
jgi:riboflavin kinase / FMN adenylyltransferase